MNNNKIKGYTKTCHFCMHNRPRKNNLCAIHRIHVSDVQTHTCEDFKVDIFMVSVEEKAEDESEIFFYLNFNSYICS
jgi:hypothetical protein